MALETVRSNVPSGDARAGRGGALPLRLRLAFIYGLLASLALLVSLVAGYGFYERAAFRNLDGALALILETALPRLPRSGPLEPPSIAPIGLREYDAGGRLLGHVVDGGAPRTDALEALAARQPAHAAWIGILPPIGPNVVNYEGLGIVRSAEGTRWRTVARRLPDGRIALVISPLEQTDRALARVRLNFLGLGLLGALVVFALGFALSGPSLRPLARLARAAQSVVHDPRESLIVAPPGDRDLTPLADALNAAFGRLQERERFVSSVLGATPGLVYVYDLERDASVYSNDQLGPLLGYSREEMRGFDGRFVETVVHTDDRQATRAHLERVRGLPDGATLENEYRARHKDGSWRWLRSRDLVFERGPDGLARLVLGVADDVTESREAQRNARFLLDLDARLREASGPAEIESVATRALGDHLGANRCLIGVLQEGRIRIGHDWTLGVPSAVGEHDLRDFYTPEAARGFSSGELRVVQDVHTDPRTRDHAGEFSSFGVRAFVDVPLFGRGGWAGLLALHRSEPHRWRDAEVKLVQDVAARLWPELERARATTALEENRARLDATFDNLPVGLALLDKDLHYVSINPTLARMNGRSVEAHLGRSLEDILPKTSPRLRPNFERVFATGQGLYNVELNGLMADGTQGSVLASWYPVKIKGETMLAGAVVLDITDRKRAEEAVRESEARYRTLLESIGQGYCVIEIVYGEGERAADYRFLEANAAFERHTGLHEPIGKTALELVPNLERVWVETYARVAETGEPIRFEQGSLAMGRVFEVDAARVGGAGSRRLALLFSDVTERRRAEAALRASEERFRAVQETTPDGFMLFETVRDEAHRIADFRWLYVNPAAEGIVGREAGDLVGKRLLEEMPGNRDEGLFDAYARVVETGEFWQREFFYEHEGLRKWFRTMAARTGNGFAVSFADITARREVEEAVRESEARYRALAQATTQFVWRDPITSQDAQTGAWWENLTGQPPGEARGAGWLEVLHPDDRERAGKAWRTAFAGGTMLETEYRVRTRGGALVHLAVRGVPIFGPDGRVLEWIGTFTDVTLEREATERLREVNEAQRRFVSDASHELRAPLTAIQGNLELLSRYPDMPPEDRATSLADAKSEAERMARLVADLLAVARGEAGLGRFETVHLEQTLRTAWRAAQQLAPGKRLELGALEEAVVDGDPDQIRQLGLILLENAVKYTPEGGTVRLESRVLDGEAEFTVSDSGVGIAPEDLPHVFDRFYRAERSRTRGPDPGGTGLGLTIARRIVDNHGGSIRLVSTLGRGTSVTVRLPLLKRSKRSKLG